MQEDAVLSCALDDGRRNMVGFCFCFYFCFHMAKGVPKDRWEQQASVTSEECDF